jgi:hypothetical protein
VPGKIWQPLQCVRRQKPDFTTPANFADDFFRMKSEGKIKTAARF